MLGLFTSHVPLMKSNPSRPQKILSAMHTVVSHDLPNQMVAVISLLQLVALEERQNLSAEGQELLDRLLDASGRANGLVTYLKEMARLDRYRPGYEEVSLAVLGKEFEAEFGAQLADHGIRISREISERVVMADRKLLWNSLRDVAFEIAEATTHCESQIKLSDSESSKSVELRLELLNGEGRPITFSLTKDWHSVLRLELSELRMSVWGGELRQTTQNAFSFIIPDRHA